MPCSQTTRPATPLVSVVIPTWNRAVYLPDAVASVCRQTFADWELIVVDDGSSDGTPAYLAGLDDPRLRVLREPHRGNPNAVRNVALGAARGRYVAFLDSDDWWEPEKLARQLAALTAHPDCGWSYTGLRCVDTGGREVPLPEPRAFEPRGGWVLERLVSGDARLQTSTVMADRALVERVGGFDERFIIAGDFDLWLRLAAESPVAPVRGALTTLRKHQGRYGARFTGSREVLDQAFTRLGARMTTPRLRFLFARLRARGLANVADLERHDRRYARAFSFLTAGLPHGLGIRRWWVVLLKTLVFPLAFWRHGRRDGIAA